MVERGKEGQKNTQFLKHHNRDTGVKSAELHLMLVVVLPQVPKQLNKQKSLPFVSINSVFALEIIGAECRPLEGLGSHHFVRGNLRLGSKCAVCQTKFHQTTGTILSLFLS